VCRLHGKLKQFSNVMPSVSPHPLWEELLRIILELEPEIRALRRYLHKHPEPSNEEFQTTKKVSEILETTGIETEIAPTGRGLITNSKFQEGSRRIALRADMDALRIQDEKNIEYRSSRPNLMHACGHDAHTAMLTGAVLALTELERRKNTHLTWRGIFQPAEETASGALEMIGWGAMKNVDAIGALHVDPLIPFGQITSRPGALTAICEEIEITVRGRGGHGARPEQTIDPIAAGTKLIQRIYREIPRQVNEPEPSVVSFGTFQAGINSNVIPEIAIIKGTLRTVSQAKSEDIKTRIQKIVTEIESETGATVAFERKYHLPSVYNDPGVYSHWKKIAIDLVEAEQFIELDRPSMGGEDFAYYLQHAPGCMLRLGVGTPDEKSHVLHSSLFDINESALALGTQLLASFALTSASN
jgi:amidohydrolase